MGDLQQMQADDAAITLAIEAVNVVGLTSFQQVLARAEAVKRERSRVFPPLAIEVREETTLTCDEMRALVRQFYGELQRGEMDAIMRDYQGTRREIQRDENHHGNAYQKAYRAKRQQATATAAAG